uniref:U19 n=1 Tax=Human betaherpesvirus 6 TaxID=10368 RepID=A0A1W6DEP4_9BETA|nr:U19 [Human betaherpesvirus 6]ARM61213.1 apoptosis inhibitor U19 [Human betaherpesvirus 6]QFX43688.1 apoptosis inhibitor U19 [Human betaherpesvirus 6]
MAFTGDELARMLQFKDKMISSAGFALKFEKVVQEAMASGIVLQHITCIKVRICDNSDILSDRQLRCLLINGLYPFEGRISMFGVTEEWEGASAAPERQVVFLLSSTGQVLGYEDGVVFYLSPTFSDFWTTAMEFSCQNAILSNFIAQKSRDEYSDQFQKYFTRMRHTPIFLTGVLPRRFQKVESGDCVEEDARASMRPIQCDSFGVKDTFCRPTEELLQPSANKDVGGKVCMALSCQEDNSARHCTIYGLTKTRGIKIMFSRHTQTDRSEVMCNAATQTGDVVDNSSETLFLGENLVHQSILETEVKTTAKNTFDVSDPRIDSVYDTTVFSAMATDDVGCENVQGGASLAQEKPLKGYCIIATPSECKPNIHWLKSPENAVQESAAVLR